MRGENHVSRIAAYEFTVGKHAQLVAVFGAVAADAIFREADSPNVKKLPKSKIADFVGFNMNNTGSVVSVQGGNEFGNIVNPNIGGDRHRFPIHKYVEMLVDMQRIALFI